MRKLHRRSEEELESARMNIAHAREKERQMKAEKSAFTGQLKASKETVSVHFHCSHCHYICDESLPDIDMDARSVSISRLLTSFTKVFFSKNSLTVG